MPPARRVALSPKYCNQRMEPQDDRQDREDRGRMAQRPVAGTVPCLPAVRYGTAVFRQILGDENGGYISLCVLPCRAVSFRREVRFRIGLAQLFRARSDNCDQGIAGRLAGHGAHRNTLCALRQSPGPRLSGWSATHWPALLRELRFAGPGAGRCLSARSGLCQQGLHGSCAQLVSARRGTPVPRQQPELSAECHLTN